MAATLAQWLRREVDEVSGGAGTGRAIALAELVADHPEN
jgi:hypothetical protein